MKKVVIVGPGGLGGTIAALLAHGGGCEVTVVGRPGAHIEAIQQNGLHLEGQQELTAQMDAFDSAQAVQECDVLIFAVKAQHTQAALEATKHIHVRDAVASVQNGVTKDELLATAFGEEKVIGAVSIVASERPAPGIVRWTFDGGTQFGELDGTPSQRVDYITELFQQAGFIADASSAILSFTWTKMVGWIPLGLIACLARKNNAGVLSNSLLAADYVEMVRELSGLAADKGLPMTDAGPYHVRSWCQGTVEEAVGRVTVSPIACSGSTHSAFQDLQQGKRTEFNACVGPVIQDAVRTALPISATRVMYSTLMALEESLART